MVRHTRDEQLQHAPDCLSQEVGANVCEPGSGSMSSCDGVRLRMPVWTDAWHAPDAPDWATWSREEIAAYFYAQGQESGVALCMMHRCAKHYHVAQLNTAEATGSECGACIQEDWSARLAFLRKRGDQ